MDIDLEKSINEAIDHLKSLSMDSFDYQLMDPIARMMLVALIHESNKIKDQIDSIGQKISDRFCEDFIPRNEIGAMPAIAVVSPTFRKNRNLDTIPMSSNVSFAFKPSGSRIALNYIPIFKNTLIPQNEIVVLTPHYMKCKNQTIDISMEKKNEIWVGINTEAELDTLKDFSFYIEGIEHIQPERITIVNNDEYDLEFSSMSSLENIEMLEPFDSQQTSGKFISLVRHWKEYLQELPNGSLFYITDSLRDRDTFKKKSFPRKFGMWLEEDALNYLDQLKDTIWIAISYPEDYTIPDNCEVKINAFPVVNIDINTITLTQASPIAKLEKQDESFFIQVIETSNASIRQGFNMSKDDIVIRDFNAACYNNGDLYRDVRNLYNHFVEDYYAFIEYNGIKDGEDIKRLKELINKIGKSVGTQNSKYKFDSGTYVMKNINQYPPSISTKVSYMTTFGEIGNSLRKTTSDNEKEQKLECKRMPIIETVVPVIVGAMGGKDRANADSRYEQLRYYTLTNDRLFTKMDVDAFVRKELISIYGKEEFKRIMIKIHIEGVGSHDYVHRGVHIDIEFKDEKNYKKATDSCLDRKLLQKIKNRSCISMPIKINLINLEK